MNTLLTSATVLADSFSLDKDTVTPGVLGFLAVFTIGVALFLLMRNMMGKLSVVRASTDETEEEGSSQVAEVSREPEGSTEPRPSGTGSCVAEATDEDSVAKG